MGMFRNLFRELALPTHPGYYAVKQPSPNSGYRVGKASDGQPSLLVSSSAQAGGTDWIGEHIDVRYGRKCALTSADGFEEEGIFTVISSKPGSAQLQEYFLDMAEALTISIGDPLEGHVAGAIKAFIELFRALQLPPRKTVGGLWAELFLIAQSADPDVLVRAWHADPTDAYDFSDGDQRIEVKSSGTRTRNHHFSLRQLQPPGDVNLQIVSVFVESAGHGLSSQDLISEIKDRVWESANLIDRLNSVVASTLGRDLTAGLQLRFDRELAAESIRFFAHS